MPNTVPNQRLVRVHREKLDSDFLGIKNETWMAASRTLGPHALRLYLYLAANADNYTLALSPAALSRDVGMPRSTYHDQFHRLVDYGYLVKCGGNLYDFYETPQSATQSLDVSAVRGYDFENDTQDEQQEPQTVNSVLPENIEINNRQTTDMATNIRPEEEKESSTVYVPRVKEITIPRPIAQGKNRPIQRSEPPKGEFDF